MKENAFEKIVCKTAAILSQPPCVNGLLPDCNKPSLQHWWNKIRKNSDKKIHLKMVSAKWQAFCLGYSVLNEDDTLDVRMTWCPCPQLIEAEWCIYASVNCAIIGSDNSLSPDQRQSIIWTNAGILLIGHLGTNFNQIQIKMQQFSFKKRHLTLTFKKMTSANCHPFCLSLCVLTVFPSQIKCDKNLYVLPSKL